MSRKTLFKKAVQILEKEQRKAIKGGSTDTVIIIDVNEM